MSRLTDTPERPFAYVGSATDPMQDARRVRKLPVEDFGSFGDDWGKWALVVTAGAFFVVSGALIYYRMGIDAFFMGAFLGVVAFILAFAALPLIVLAYPSVGTGIMTVAGIVGVTRGLNRIDWALAFAITGLTLTLVGAWLAKRAYYSPASTLPEETPRAVFGWRD